MAEIEHVVYLYKKYVPTSILTGFKFSILRNLYLQQIVMIELCVFVPFIIFAIVLDYLVLFNDKVISFYVYNVFLELILFVIIQLSFRENVDYQIYIIISLLISLITLYHTYIQYFVTNLEDNSNTKAINESIVEFNKDFECIICLEDGTVGYSVKKCNCLVVYHKDCIIAWLTKKQVCPICKNSILTQY